MRMLTRRASYRTCLVVAIVLTSGVPKDLVGAVSPAPWTSLSRPTSFDAWRENHRGWKIVGDVSLNSEVPKRFDEKPGHGTLVAEGKAANLESRDEYQDLDVRLAFSIPKRSNSGGQLIGRYESQI